MCIDFQKAFLVTRQCQSTYARILMRAYRRTLKRKYKHTYARAHTHTHARAHARARVCTYVYILHLQGTQALKQRPQNGSRSRYLMASPKIEISRYSSKRLSGLNAWAGMERVRVAIASPLQPLVGQINSKSNNLFT